MGLTYVTDISVADWLVRSDTPAAQLILFGPAGYEAYARLRFIPDPSSANQPESRAEIADDHPSDMSQVRRAIQSLARFTTTPEELYVGVWEGYSDIDLRPEMRSGPLVTLPDRRYVLFRGGVSDIDSWEADLCPTGDCAPPALVWPVDRTWFLADDVDPHWAGIGADKAAVDALMRETGLDVVRADPADVQPAYR
jgi:hypothetical protein